MALTASALNIHAGTLYTLFLIPPKALQGTMAAFILRGKKRLDNQTEVAQWASGRTCTQTRVPEPLKTPSASLSRAAAQ